ncbi:MAG TPA: STAS domain-containing protein [Anaerolineae bacterium]|jgi:anti-sigma B factor antagonist
MPTKQLEATVRTHAGSASIDLKGEINSLGEPAMDAAYAQAIQQNPTVILLNFREVDYINSTGIALIVSLMARARKEGRRLVASNLSEHYVEIFKITRLSDFMPIFPDEASALAAPATH